MEISPYIVSADQLPPKTLEAIFEKAEEIRKVEDNNPGSILKILMGKIAVVLFWESSTRTYVRSCVAINKLGGNFIPVNNAGVFSSAVKGESLQDTIRTLADSFVDIIIMRHNKEGSARIAAETLKKFAPWVRLINAGDGKGEHPTQMGLDIYTIWRNKKDELKKKQLVVALVGELRDSRVFHSDAKALISWGIKKLILISEKGNDLPEEILAEARKKGITCIKTSDTLEYAEEVDVWIFTRLQVERKKFIKNILKVFPFLRSRMIKKYNKRFGMNKKIQAKMKPDTLVMHPLPRVKDMPEWMDEDKRAVYLSRGGKEKESQVKNGLYFQMAMTILMFEQE